MPDRSFLHWPFFDASHQELARDVDAWAGAEIPPLTEEEHDVDATCRALVRKLGERGWLKYVIPAAHGGAQEKLDVRALCLIRETLARWSGLADFAFAMQGLGGGPVSLFGSDDLKRRYLPRIGRGEAIAAFAISEPDAGSDVRAMRTTARRDGDGYVIDGTKTWISNAGIADHYAVFCRFPEAGERATIGLMVDAGTAGFEVSDRIAVTAPHPLGTLTFEQCRVPAAQVIGEPGSGLAVALGTLDVFRSTVGAAALGFARRALDEALEWCVRRQVFGKSLAQQQLTQARLADMALDVDAGALLIYRAAWTYDQGRPVTREAAMAKLHATEAAQRVADSAVQLFGGRGVAVGEIAAQLLNGVEDAV